MKTAIVSTALICLVLGAGGGWFVKDHLSAAQSSQPYADEQGRAISSLSRKDVEQIRAGAGWGLAKPAEFNGYPGPAHLLEFADKMDFEPSQEAAIRAAFGAMQAEAKRLGVGLIEAEAALDEAFRNTSIDEASLRTLLARAAEARAALREVHLATHLKVTPLLSEQQKTRYAELRGYGGDHTGHGGH